MNKIHRRAFLKTTATGLGGALLFSQIPQQVSGAARFAGIPIGFQTWPVKDVLAKDFAGTLKNMAALGYEQVEMCSPKGYEKMGFGALAQMKVSDMRNVIRDAGLSCPSSHFTMAEFADDVLDDRIEFAKGLGMKHMICSSLGLPKTAPLNDYLAKADSLNKAAVKIKKAGLQAGFHNHSIEFVQLDGRLIYDALLERFDPDLVKLQFQTEVINLGFKGAPYLNKFPGRFISAHLSDWTADKKEVPVGKGIINWKEFFDAAKQSGVQTYFVEMAPATYKESAAYIRSLR
jgi:sugar phosphate isomerase/epimerase